MSGPHLWAPLVVLHQCLTLRRSVRVEDVAVVPGITTLGFIRGRPGAPATMYGTRSGFKTAKGASARIFDTCRLVASHVGATRAC